MNYPINCPVNHFIDYPSIPLMISLIISKKSFPISVGELSQAHSHSSETRWESHAFVEACRGWQGSLRDLSLGHMAWHQVDVGTWMCIPLSKWFLLHPCIIHIIQFICGDIPDITGGITHLPSGMRPQVWKPAILHPNIGLRFVGFPGY